MGNCTLFSTLFLKQINEIGGNLKCWATLQQSPPIWEDLKGDNSMLQFVVQTIAWKTCKRIDKSSFPSCFTPYKNKVGSILE